MKSTAINLWCYQPEKNHDKVYGLYLFAANGKFDVFSIFGRRGYQVNTHVWEDGVDEKTAVATYNRLLKEKFGKGYKEIVESAACCSKDKFPTLALPFQQEVAA